MYELDLEKVWFLPPGFGAIKDHSNNYCALTKLYLALGHELNGAEKVYGTYCQIIKPGPSQGLREDPDYEIWHLNDARDENGMNSTDNHYKALRLGVDRLLATGKVKIKDSLTVDQVIEKARVSCVN